MIDPDSTADSAAPRRELSLFDSVCIIVGIVIGAGIYKAPLVAGNVSGDWSLILVWVLGGVLSLAGSLCYAELATAYPKEGGDYVFLNEAFGRRWGFLFAWAQLWVIRPGSIGAMAFVFADYANQLFPLGDSPAVSGRLCGGGRRLADGRQSVGHSHRQVDAKSAFGRQVSRLGNGLLGGFVRLRCPGGGTRRGSGGDGFVRFRPSDDFRSLRLRRLE